MKTTLDALNAASREDFVDVCGPLFEHSPWVAERTAGQRPFATLESLHVALCQTVAGATLEAQVALISAHPDLAGRAAEAGELTAASTAEQAAAGLNTLSDSARQQLRDYNLRYKERFSFPFVICARENKAATILAAFPRRLANDRAQEIAIALTEIGKIAWLRLLDRVEAPGSHPTARDRS